MTPILNREDFPTLGDRMKDYELAYAGSVLDEKVPVCIRIDGKAFHTLLRDCVKPFDRVIRETMHRTMFDLCSSIQGCIFGYTQSDEITLILIDYKREDTSAWFGNRIQKICSVSASMATQYFRNNLLEIADKEINYEDDRKHYIEIANKALFDSRCFSIPEEEVMNVLWWRQEDALRNSMQSLALSEFSAKECYKLSCKQLVEKLKKEKMVDFDNLNPYDKAGAVCFKEYFDKVENDFFEHPQWKVEPAYGNWLLKDKNPRKKLELIFSYEVEGREIKV